MTSAPVDVAKAVRPRRREPLLALAVAVGIAALGLPLGLLWYLVAPRAPAVLTQDGPVLTDGEPEQFIADDGWYILIAIVAGVVVAIAVWALFRRHRGPLLLLALIIGSVAAGVLAASLGHEIGLAEYHRMIRNAKAGTHVALPPFARTADYGMWFAFLPRVRGTALTQAVAATLIYTMLAAFHPTADLDTPPENDAASDPTGGPSPGGPTPGGPTHGEPTHGEPTHGEAAPQTGFVGWGISSDSTQPPTPPGAPAPPAPGRAAPPPD